MTSNTNSCVETPAAPEWLSKLENRRENLKRGKLGHEAGAGAPCNECQEKCPGLDLHFWRKVCRNCKCRKDQHLCADDDMSGWAQFEILGQIRSKPAFIKIKALANQPVHLEWTPPNAAPDVISDYMEKLGTTNIPVAGSNAANKRKQQLEFQVPPHDLDASLCDNLTESESNQLQKYVQTIRENCVGQGTVVRIGNVGHCLVGHFAQEHALANNVALKPEYLKVLKYFNEVSPPNADALLVQICSTEKLANAIIEDPPSAFQKLFIVFSEPISDSAADFETDSPLSNETKQKLCGLNKDTLQSLVKNGPIYDKVLAALQEKNLNISRDPKLGPIADFRKEYVRNPQFKKEIDAVCQTSAERRNAQQTTPIRSKQAIETPFNSPLPLKSALLPRFSAQMRQETPMRKVMHAGIISNTVNECGLPSNVDYDKDPVFAQILHSEPLKQALQNALLGRPTQPVIVAAVAPTNDIADVQHGLSAGTKMELQKLGINTNMLRSALLNRPFYGRLYETLHDKQIKYGNCKILKPLEHLYDQLCTNPILYNELREYVIQMPKSLDCTYDTPQHSALTNSKSSDSGFDSKPSTPNQSNYPNDEITASVGRFATIPGIEDMNMYPNCLPDIMATGMSHALQQLTLQTNNDQTHSTATTAPAATLKCNDCLQSINFGEIAVKAERAGKEIAWHPECFKCRTCRELLADLVYFFHHGQVYCGRDLAIKLKIPRCRACDELIFTKEYTAAEGATFHIKHFCCYQCDTPLAGQQYIPDEKSNMPLCLKCYDEFFAAACQLCRRPIGPADEGVSWGEIHWHGSCFICAGAQCAKSLIGGRFCVKQNMPFCSPACVRSIIN